MYVLFYLTRSDDKVEPVDGDCGPEDDDAIHEHEGDADAQPAHSAVQLQWDVALDHAGWKKARNLNWGAEERRET